jgi:uncharacterized protein YggE
MNKSLQTLILIVAFFMSSPQAISQFKDTRMITVTGSAELFVEPDEIIFQITIKEYWEEEFQKNTQYKDYKTKVPLDKIEPVILAQLKEAGVKESQIKVASMGNYYRPAGKEFLVSKSLEICVQDFETIDRISKNVDARGVSNMHIKELKNKDMDAHKERVRVMAIEAAKKKATYLLAALDEKPGKVLLVREQTISPSPYRPEGVMMNRSADGGGQRAATDLKKIRLSYSIEVTFMIAE